MKNIMLRFGSFLFSFFYEDARTVYSHAHTYVQKSKLISSQVIAFYKDCTLAVYF